MSEYPPRETGLAPVKAIPKALERAGLSIADVRLFEINEAFASMCVATTRLLELDILAARIEQSEWNCWLLDSRQPRLEERLGPCRVSMRERIGNVFFVRL